MMERLLEEMRTIQEKMDANQPRMEAKIGTEIKTIQDKMVGQEEIKAQVCPLAFRIDVNQEEMKAMLDACLEKMEANPGKLQSLAVHQVSKEVAAVATFRALRKRHRDRHLVVRRRGQPEKRTQDNGGSRKRLAAARRGMARRVGVAWCKRSGHAGQMVNQRR
jgi:hypothetical protein